MRWLRRLRDRWRRRGIKRYPKRFVEGVNFEKIGGFLGFACTYRLLGPYAMHTEFRPDHDIVGAHGLCGIRADGWLWGASGYTWDGASTPAWDTPSVIRASLVHDIPYQLLREMDLDAWDRAPADRLLRRVMLEDGAWKWRAAYFEWGVRRFAAGAARARSAITGGTT
jgi:hypothetical protein